MEGSEVYKNHYSNLPKYKVVSLSLDQRLFLGETSVFDALIENNPF